jgi:hypothetical protein|tara:strand:- start:258 stop:833 length:576 start_codon:yes stop_codon:yes gene_type:complete
MTQFPFYLHKTHSVMLGAMGATAMHYGAYGCADEVAIPTVLALGRSRDMHMHGGAAPLLSIDFTACPVAFFWGQGHSGGPWFEDGAPRVRGSLIHTDMGGAALEKNMEEEYHDRCEAETVLAYGGGYGRGNGFFYGGVDPGVWWETSSSPLVFKTLPRGLIDAVQSRGHLFLRKVVDGIAIEAPDLTYLYG